MNAPVYRAFAGMHDVAVGIQERASPTQLRTLSDTAGLQVHRLRLWPFSLSVPIFAVRQWQRLKLLSAGNPEVVSDVSLPPAWLNRCLGGVCQIESLLFKRPWWGSSCFIVCQKTVKVSK
jgi:hypothetical protein